MSTLNVNRIVDTSGGVLAPISSVMRNRIINGAMVISQRNGTSSVTPASGDYTLDRWKTLLSQTSKLTVQQNAGAVTPPAGYTNYLGITSSSAYSITSTDFFLLSHCVEGFNTADLSWGTADAKSITISFWVRSSLTGTFGCALRNAANNRYYPFTYSIPAANTWTQISVTIAGDTTGTWATNNTTGIEVMFGLGVGSTYSGTAGAWTGTLNTLAPTGATSVVGTNGATFYITGVQLEKGTQATSFEYRQYQQELALCQRYFTTSFQNGGTPASPNSLAVNQTGLYFINGSASVSYPVPMRASPTVICFAPLANPAINNVRQGSNGAIGAGTVSFVGERNYTQFGPSDGVQYQFGYTANAEL
jgi:hypothetical protein